MKLIIDIPDDYVGIIMSNQRIEGSAMDKRIRQAVIDGTPLSREATNGDVIKALFNVEILFVSTQFNVITVRYDNHSKTYDLSWWNAPYKKR